jgi:hypothetical protein
MMFSCGKGSSGEHLQAVFLLELVKYGGAHVSTTQEN